MAYKPVDRSYNEKYLAKQQMAIKWLAAQGMSYEEIRTATWGMVDDGDKTIAIPTRICSIRYDCETDLVFRQEHTKRVKIRLTGTENEQFFLKSKIPCTWMFTRERPRTWRKEGSKESLYSLPEIQRIIEGDEAARLNNGAQQLDGSMLTKLLKFATIEVSKLNITKSEPTEGIEEAEVVI